MVETYEQDTDELLSAIKGYTSFFLNVLETLVRSEMETIDIGFTTLNYQTPFTHFNTGAERFSVFQRRLWPSRWMLARHRRREIVSFLFRPSLYFFTYIRVRSFSPIALHISKIELFQVVLCNLQIQGDLSLWTQFGRWLIQQNIYYYNNQNKSEDIVIHLFYNYNLAMQTKLLVFSHSRSPVPRRCRRWLAECSISSQLFGESPIRNGSTRSNKRS